MADLSIKLYSFYRSSCSGRLRLALNLKGLSYQYCATDTEDGEQFTAEYKALNPSSSVPTLVVEGRKNAEVVSQPNQIVIGQSWAALIYLDEAFPDLRPLMPNVKHPEIRALVTELAMIIIADTQPLTNTRVFPRVDELGGDRNEWTRRWYHRGLRSYDTLASRTAGRYSVGDEVTLADVCLVPAVWNTERAGILLDEFPTVARIMGELRGLPEVKAAHWRCQPDTPESEKNA